MKLRALSTTQGYTGKHSSNYSGRCEQISISGVTLADHHLGALTLLTFAVEKVLQPVIDN